jgi:hypothetical protein
LQRLGFNAFKPASDHLRPHRTIYLQLRTAINEHLASGDLPELGLSLKPTGAFDWQPVPAETVREVDLMNDDVAENGVDDADDEIEEE